MSDRNFKRDRAYNYASSLATAIRNALDPNDPDRDQYRTEHAPARMASFLEYIEEKGIDPATASTVLQNALRNVIGQLTDGTLDAIREQVENANKGE